MTKSVGLILSAGYSSRMPVFKPLMQFKGTPFLLSTVLKLTRVCSEVVVVTGFRAEEITSRLAEWLDGPYRESWAEEFGLNRALWKQVPDKIRIQYNPDYAGGMFISLQAGLRAVVKGDWVLYHFVDQPHIPYQFYGEFVSQISPEYDWIQPRFEDKSGHPLLFNRKVVEAILKAGPTETLRTVSERIQLEKKIWVCRYPQILDNFNTKSDVNNVRKNNEHI